MERRETEQPRERLTITFTFKKKKERLTLGLRKNNRGDVDRRDGSGAKAGPECSARVPSFAKKTGPYITPILKYYDFLPSVPL